MRIALFYNLAFGGAKRVVMEHAKGLKEKGYTIDLYTTNIEYDAFDPSSYCNNIYNFNINVGSSFPFIKRFITDYNNFYLLKNLHQKIAQDIDKRHYDLVLVHPDKFTQAPFLLRFLKTPSVYYCQEPLRIVYEYSLRFNEPVNILKRIYEELTRMHRKQIDLQNTRSASYTIASCYYVRERMIESYMVYPKVVYCAVNHHIFRPKNIKKKNQIFFVGSSLVWEDGFDLAKDALKFIPAKLAPKLKVVSWKKSNGERLTEEELVQIYNESLATICSSRLETFGLVPLESMACGVPVIATNVSGHRETVINDKTGFLVDFEPQEITEKILLLIKNKEKAREIGRNARKHIEKYWIWEKNIEQLDKTLKTFLARIE